MRRDRIIQILFQQLMLISLVVTLYEVKARNGSHTLPYFGLSMIVISFLGYIYFRNKGRR